MAQTGKIVALLPPPCPVLGLEIILFPFESRMTQTNQPWENACEAARLMASGTASNRKLWGWDTAEIMIMSFVLLL